MALFDWMSQAQAAVNNDPNHQRLGSANINVLFKGGVQRRLVTFRAFRVDSIDILSKEQPDFSADVVLEMSARKWNAYMRQRQKNRAKDLLSLDTVEHIIQADTPLKRLLFNRVHLSIQSFIDAGACSLS